MSSLKNKKILFFAPKFFNYEIAIKDEMERQGADVHLYDERNNPSSAEKILLRKAHFLMKGKIVNYYIDICERERAFEPDYVFFISPETVNESSILRMRETFPSAKFILYMWDSIENKNAKKVYKYFDNCLSFDSDDCIKYGFNFRPLFFIKTYEKKLVRNSKLYKYDFAFIGSVHSDRAKILNQLKRCFESDNLTYFYYLYVPGKLMLFLRTLLDKDFRELKKKFVHLKPLSKEIASKVLSDTNYVIDINHPKQVGLTMRTLEMLGSHRRLLTTNSHIREYDFFNPMNQIVVSRHSIVIDKSNLKSEYSPVPEEIYEKYKLSTWLEEVLN